jgi:hypothetical protein
MQPHQVAEILGHTTAALIWKTYGHVIPKDLQKAVESMDALFPAPSAQAVASPPAPGTSNETSTRTTPQDRRPALDTALIPVGAGV